VRLATVDLKAPLRSVQAASAQQAGALAQLSQQQVALQRQVEDGQMLIGALQGLAAKQFNVGVGVGWLGLTGQAGGLPWRLDAAAACFRPLLTLLAITLLGCAHTHSGVC
jgi:hypothetical protein